MRENRTSGSEGGGAGQPALPTPIPGAFWSPRRFETRRMHKFGLCLSISIPVRSSVRSTTEASYACVLKPTLYLPSLLLLKPTRFN